MPGGQITRGRISKTISANNAAATVTTPTPGGGQSVYIIAIHASFITALTTGALMTLTDGTTTLGNYIVHSERDVEPCLPIQVTPGLAAVVSLAASGAGGNIGYVTVDYYIG